MNRNLLLLTLVAILGCQDSDLETEGHGEPAQLFVQNGRLVFPNADLFFETISNLNTMSEAARNEWQMQYGLSNRLEPIAQDDSELMEAEAERRYFPIGYQMVLNGNGEVQIGEEIVWYNRGVKHFVSSEDELRAVKDDPIISKNRGQYSIEKVGGESSAENSSSLINISYSGGLDARYQKEFHWCGSSGSLRKWVNELYTFRDHVAPFEGGFTFRTTLLLRMKLEWKGSGGWKPAGETRYIDFDVYGPMSFNNFAGGIDNLYLDASSNGTLTRSSDAIVTLFQGVFHYYNGTFTPYYRLELRGAISQVIRSINGAGTCNPYYVGGYDTVLW